LHTNGPETVAGAADSAGQPKNSEAMTSNPSTPSQTVPFASPPETALSPRRSVVAVSSFRIHAAEYGTGDETVLLLHGLSGSSRWWQRNLRGLSRRFRVLVPDGVGFGRSRPRGAVPSIPETAEVLAEWMGKVGIETTHVIGHSMGGQISTHLAARFPERLQRLVLVDAAGIPRPLRPRALARFALDVAPPARWGDPLFFPVILGDALSAGPRTILRAVGHILDDDVRPFLPEIRAKTLVVWGEKDALVPLSHAQIFREQIPDARLAIIRGAAHNPMVDRPAAFNRLVLRFLQGADVGG
jgi:pimeloyl-ACP methyl ester carboxylesterase